VVAAAPLLLSIMSMLAGVTICSRGILMLLLLLLLLLPLLLVVLALQEESR